LAPMSLKEISLAFVSITASSVLVANEVFFNNNFDQNQTNLSGIYNDQYSQQKSLDK